MVARGAAQETVINYISVACPPLAPFLVAGQTARYLYGGMKAAAVRHKDPQKAKEFLLGDGATKLMGG